jgi:hypothetical protein
MPLLENGTRRSSQGVADKAAAIMRIAGKAQRAGQLGSSAKRAPKAAAEVSRDAVGSSVADCWVITSLRDQLIKNVSRY